MQSEMPPKGYSIRTKLALLFIGFSLIPSCIVGAVSYWYSKTLSEKYALNLESLAVDTMNRVNTFFPHTHNDAIAPFLTGNY